MLQKEWRALFELWAVDFKFNIHHHTFRSPSLSLKRTPLFFMKLVILLFPDPDQLMRFRWAVDPKVYQVDLENNSLFCFCDEDQVELANYVYGASVLEVQGGQN